MKHSSKVLLCSDLHANRAHYAWLKENCRDYGLVVLAGDQLDLLAHAPQAGQLEEVVSMLKAIDAPKLAIISGNHDSIPGAVGKLAKAAWLQDLRQPNVRVDGDVFEFAGHTIRCLGWNAMLPTSGEGEIWIYHAPPRTARTALVAGGISFGCLELDDLCKSGRGPKLVLGGHVHEAVAWHATLGGCSSLNPRFAGRNTARPNHIVIDLERGTATHHSATGEKDIVRLWTPSTEERRTNFKRFGCSGPRLQDVQPPGDIDIPRI